MVLDKSEAEHFIATLKGNVGAKVTFQTFDDNEQAASKNTSLSKVLHGTLDEQWNTLEYLNNQGAGIFIMVNDSDFKIRAPKTIDMDDRGTKGRSRENVCRLRALIIDQDGGEEIEFTDIKPSMVVKTSHGKHSYFLLKEEDGYVGHLDYEDGFHCARFTDAEKILISHFGTYIDLKTGKEKSRVDSQCTDSSRVLRVPGFLHKKDPNHPVLIQIVGDTYPDLQYTIAQITAAYPAKNMVDEWLKPAEPIYDPDFNVDEAVGLARKYVDGLQPCPVGESNVIVFEVAKHLAQVIGLTFDQALPFMHEWNNKRNKNRLPDSQLKSTLKTAVKNKEKYAPKERLAKIREHCCKVKPVDDIMFIKSLKKFKFKRASGKWSDTYDDEIQIMSDVKRLHPLISQTDIDCIIRHQQCLPVQNIDKVFDKPEIYTENDYTYFNEYVGSTFDSSKVNFVPGQYPDITKILMKMTNNSVEGIKWIEQWFSQKVKRPTDYQQTSLVIYGSGNTGKGTLLKILGLVFGSNNVLEIGADEIANDFNGIFTNKLLVNVNESFTRANALGLKEKLKRLINSPTIPYNEKHIAKRVVTNRISWIFTSNNDVPVPIDTDDRRFTIFNDGLLGRTVDEEYKQWILGLHDKNTKTGFTEDMTKQIAAWFTMLKDLKVDESIVNWPFKNQDRIDAQDEAGGTVEDWFTQANREGLNPLMEDWISAEKVRNTFWPEPEYRVDDGFLPESVYEAYKHFARKTGGFPIKYKTFFKRARTFGWEIGRYRRNGNDIKIFIPIKAGDRVIPVKKIAVTDSSIDKKLDPIGLN